MNCTELSGLTGNVFW